MSDEKILVPLAEGFEEVEAVAIVDVLRRAELDVILAGLAPGPVRGAHGITLETDTDLDSLDLDTITTIVLPGGMPGTTHLMEDERVLGLVRRLSAAGRTTAAICAAPMVLEAAGVIADVAVTSHPSVWERLGTARLERESRVVKSGTVITSQGPGTALEFALTLVSELRGPAEARALAGAMLAN